MRIDNEFFFIDDRYDKDLGKNVLKYNDGLIIENGDFLELSKLFYTENQREMFFERVKAFLHQYMAKEEFIPVINRDRFIAVYDGLEVIFKHFREHRDEWDSWIKRNAEPEKIDNWQYRTVIKSYIHHLMFGSWGTGDDERAVDDEFAVKEEKIAQQKLENNEIETITDRQLAIILYYICNLLADKFAKNFKIKNKETLRDMLYCGEFVHRLWLQHNSSCRLDQPDISILFLWEWIQENADNDAVIHKDIFREHLFDLPSRWPELLEAVREYDEEYQDNTVFDDIMLDTLEMRMNKKKTWLRNIEATPRERYVCVGDVVDSAWLAKQGIHFANSTAEQDYIQVLNKKLLKNLKEIFIKNCEKMFENIFDYFNCCCVIPDWSEVIEKAKGGNDFYLRIIYSQRSKMRVEIIKKYIGMSSNQPVVLDLLDKEISLKQFYSLCNECIFGSQQDDWFCVFDRANENFGILSKYYRKFEQDTLPTNYAEVSMMSKEELMCVVHQNEESYQDILEIITSSLE